MEVKKDNTENCGACGVDMKKFYYLKQTKSKRQFFHSKKNIVLYVTKPFQQWRQMNFYWPNEFQST